MNAMNFKTLHVWDTVYSADSVEWCPHSPHKNYFACGTYQLMDKVENNVQGKGYGRTGSIIILKISKNNLVLVHQIDCPAVLDLKWCTKRLNEKITLAGANAAGEISVFYFEDEKLKFVTKCVIKNCLGDFLVTSLDWGKENFSDLICSSDSKGNITLLKFSSVGLTVLKSWNSHSLEAWIVCFDSFNQNIIYSGGDEACLKVWDCRLEDPLKVITKHSAGVTALASNIFKEFNLVSGSYDETVKFWDTRNFKTAVKTISASGGVWRLKWEPKKRKQYLLAACVYGGFQIYDTHSFSVVSEYKEHESLAYGADWCYLDNDEIKKLLERDESALIATCSFYDHKLCVSSWT